MMSIFVLIDAAPPVSIGIVLAVLLFVIAAVILMAVGLILILWYRKGSLRACERSTGQQLWWPLDGGRARAKRHGILSPADSEPRMPGGVKETLTHCSL